MNLKEFSRANLARCIAKDGFNHSLDSWSHAEWTNAMAGELGELVDELLSSGLRSCNTSKKIIRYRNDIAGNIKPEDKDLEELKKRARREVADAIAYGDLVIQALGGDTEEELREVWNKKSRDIGYPVRLVGDYPDIGINPDYEETDD